MDQNTLVVSLFFVSAAAVFSFGVWQLNRLKKKKKESQQLRDPD